MRSHSGPVNGADTAQEIVSNPRNHPAEAGVPPSASMRYGATGSNWKTETNTRKLKPNIVRNLGVTSGGVIGDKYRGSGRDRRIGNRVPGTGTGRVPGTAGCRVPGPARRQ